MKNLQTEWARIVAKAWHNAKFKQRLLDEPAAVLREIGIALPAGLQVRIVENTDRLVYLTLPAQPEAGALSEAELEKVAGGVAAVNPFPDPIDQPF